MLYRAIKYLKGGQFCIVLETSRKVEPVVKSLTLTGGCPTEMLQKWTSTCIRRLVALARGHV